MIDVMHILLTVVVALFGSFTAIIAFVGRRFLARVDRVEQTVIAMGREISKMAGLMERTHE